MVAINVVPEQDKDVPAWRTKGGYTFPVLLSESGFAETNFGVHVQPTNFLLDADRRLVFRHLGYGAGGEKQIEAEIRELLGLDPFPPDPPGRNRPPRRSVRHYGWLWPGCRTAASLRAASATRGPGVTNWSPISRYTR